MSRLSSEAKEAVIALAVKRGFVDPITGEPPSNERELAAVLALQHQRGCVSWERVPSTPVTNLPTTLAGATLVAPSDLVCAEYPLIASDPRQLEVWGGIPADLIFVARDFGRVVLVESKIGSGLTYGSSPETGQLARQQKYLQACKPALKIHVLLAAGILLDQGWYQSELRSSIEARSPEPPLAAFLMRWEDVLNAFANLG
jgi:hypothetical protein